MPDRAAGSADAGERAFRLLLLALMLVGAALRAVHLDTTLSHDEVETVKRYVQGGPATIFATHGGYGSTNNHLLNSLFAWASVRAFGLHVWALRLPSYVFGVLAVPLVGLVARKLLRDRLAAGSATLLAALSPILIAYAPACRGYGPLVFFALLSLWLLVRAVDDGEVRKLPLLALALLAGGWSHMAGLVFAATCALCVLVLLASSLRADDPLRANRRPAFLALGSVALAGMLLTAWYSRASLILQDVQSRIVHGTFVDPSLSGVKSVHAEQGLVLWIEHTAKEFLGVRGVLLLVAAPLLAASIPLALKRDGRRGALLACALFFPPAAFLVGNLKPFPRYFLFVQPFVLIAVAGTLAWLARVLAQRSRGGILHRPVVVLVLLTAACEGLSFPWLREHLAGPGANFMGVEWDIAGGVDELAAELELDDVVLSFPRPRVRGDWHEWAFAQSFAFHEQRSLAPLLARPSSGEASVREVWYVTPERVLPTSDLFPPGWEPRLVAERWGCFLYRAALACAPLVPLELPALDLAHGSLGAWRLEDPFSNVTLRLDGADADHGERISLAVGLAGGDARVLSPPIPLAGGTLVELSTEVAAEQSDGMRPCGVIGLDFYDQAGERVGSAARTALLWEGLRPQSGWSFVRLTTFAPRSARSVELCLSLDPGHPDGSVIHFRPPRLRVSAVER